MEDGESSKEGKDSTGISKLNAEKPSEEGENMTEENTSISEEAGQAMEDSMQACEAELAMLTERIQQSWTDSGIQHSPDHVLGVIRQKSTESLGASNKTEVIREIMEEMDRVLRDILTEEEMMTLKRNLSISDEWLNAAQQSDALPHQIDTLTPHIDPLPPCTDPSSSDINLLPLVTHPLPPHVDSLPASDCYTYEETGDCLSDQDDTQTLTTKNSHYQGTSESDILLDITTADNQNHKSKELSERNYSDLLARDGKPPAKPPRSFQYIPDPDSDTDAQKMEYEESGVQNEWEGGQKHKENDSTSSVNSSSVTFHQLDTSSLSQQSLDTLPSIPEVVIKEFKNSSDFEQCENQNGDNSCVIESESFRNQLSEEKMGTSGDDVDLDGEDCEQRHLMQKLGLNQVNTDHLVIYFINGDIFHDMQSISENGRASTDDLSATTDETVRLVNREASLNLLSPVRASVSEEFSEDRTADSRSSGRRTVSPPNQLDLLHQAYTNHVGKVPSQVDKLPLTSDRSYEASISSNNQTNSFAQSENGLTLISQNSSYENISLSPCGHSSGPNEVFEEECDWFNQKIKEIEQIEKNGTVDIDIDDDREYSFLEFAQKHFNIHTREPGSIVRTLNMARRKSQEIVPVQDMITYTKAPVIYNSHIKLSFPENVNTAITIFKDIVKYIRGELKDDLVNLTIRGIIAYGIDRVELRDEIYIQLMRQTNANPHGDNLIRAWTLLCQCSVSFPPNAYSIKYIMSYARKNSEDPVVGPYASYLLENLKSRQSHVRKMPPSSAEIEAVKNLQPLVCRIHFLDGKTKAVGVRLLDTTRDVLHTVCDKISLQNTAGWALYESTPDHDRYIHESEYIADIMAEWEEKHKSLFASLKSASPKRGQSSSVAMVSSSPGITYGRLIFCKRIFQHAHDIPNDPTEYHLLYAQAVHYVVQIDEYAVPKSIALQLAGLQSQVIHGDYQPSKMSRYYDVEEYLSAHLRELYHQVDWSSEIAAAHKKYGFGKTELDAKISYLLIVTQFPLYGCTKFMVDFKGVWQHGCETVFVVCLEGIKFISLLERSLTHEFSYAEIEKLSLDMDDDYVIVELKNFVQSPLKSFVFESHDKGDIRTLIENYSPRHATWTKEKTVHLSEKLHLTDVEKLQAPSHVMNSRQKLIESKLLNKPVVEGLGFIRNTLRKFTRPRSESLSDSDDDSSFFKDIYWSFSKTPFRQSLLALDSREHDDIAVRIFNSSLVYAGIEAAGALEDSDHLAVVQTLMAKCMESNDLCNEFYLQLIKQTTDAPMVMTDPNNRFGVRYWQLLTMATCLMLPSSKTIFNFLTWHLKKHATYPNLEEGKYALFSLRCLHRTCEMKGRKHPPSFLEIMSICKRRIIRERVHFQDGQCHFIEFDSATTVDEILRIIKAKIGMRSDTRGFAFYEEFGSTEQYLCGSEKLADALFKWERWAHSLESKKELKFSFKKRLFMDPFVNVCDAVEVDLVYHQSVTDVFEEKIPLSKQDATQLCALRAQSEYGDHGVASHFDYSSVMRILPRPLREVVSVLDIAQLHHSLIGMTYTGANLAFMDVLKNWPLFGSTVFEVSQTYSETLPNCLWVSVSQVGLHLVEIKGNTIYSTIPYKELAHYSDTDKELVVITGTVTRGPKLNFSTPEASEIVHLINDYKMALSYKTRTSYADMSAADEASHHSSQSTTVEMTSL